MASRRTTPQSQLTFLFGAPRLRLYLLTYWQEAAACVGCARPEAAIIHTYRRTGSIAKTAAILNFSETTIRKHLHQLREPVKPRGGNNNPYGRRGKPDKDRSPLP